MGTPKEHGWGYAKSMVMRYPDRVNENEKQAVEAAIQKTRVMKTGEQRMKIIDMVLIRKTHTIQGAAMKAYCSERTALNYHREFITEVGKCFHCDSLW